MSEVIFKNEHGEYRVGDRVAFVTTGYGHSVTFGKATIRGITEGGCLRLDVDDQRRDWVSADTGELYDWDVDGYLKKTNWHDETATGVKPVARLLSKRLRIFAKPLCSLTELSSCDC